MEAGGGALSPTTATGTTEYSDPFSGDGTGKMMEVTYVNPYTWESENARASSKAKRTSKGRNKRCPPGVSIMERAIDKTKKLREIWRTESQKREVQFLNGCKLSERDASLKPITEQPFGILYVPDNGGLCDLTEKVATDLSASVVSLALFDGDVMLFACSGISLPDRTVQLKRFLTSACLVDVFHAKRNTEDNLNIKVCLPNKKTLNGFLELYDKDIAIITSLTHTRVRPVDLNGYATTYSAAVDAAMPIVAAGRSFDLCRLMAVAGTLAGQYECNISGGHVTTEAALGGPIVDLAGNFLGMNVCCGNGTICFIPQHVILQRLYQFRLLNPRNVQEGDYATKDCTDDLNPHGAGSTVGGTKMSSHKYIMPPGAKQIEPSGFLRNLNKLTRLGYPKPPPLMLELNGRLVHKFEEVFGYLHARRGYVYNLDYCGDGMNAWARLDAKTITTISRRVVSLSSYNGNVRFFSCTGLLIKYPSNTDSGSYRRTVILTSASLVRSVDKPDTINKKLRIEVFLPPRQHAIGELESYDLHHNIAIVSFMGLRAIRAEDIFNLESSDLRPEHVVAIGCEPDEGLLCASAGKLTDEPITALPCKHLKASTCKIKKAGIGGPLINFYNGSFIGMNFYYGNSKITPFLPKSKIVDVLKELEHLSGSAIQMAGDHPAPRLDRPAETSITERWPVPQAYWYDDLLKEDWNKGNKFIEYSFCVCEICVYWRHHIGSSRNESVMDPEATSAPSPSVANIYPSESLMNPEGTSAPSRAVGLVHPSESVIG